MDAPATPIGMPQAGPAPVPTAAPPVQPVAPAVGAVGPPAAAPVVAPAVTQPVVESPELVQIRAERAQLQAELARLQPYAAIGYKTTQQQPAPAAPAAPTKPSLGVPVLDPNVAAYLTEDTSGRVVEIPGAPPGTLAAYNAHQRAKGQFLAKLTENPKEALAPLLEEIQAAATEKAKAEVLAEQTKARNNHLIGQIIETNADWMFEKDTSGNRVVLSDPLTGNRQWKKTEAGEVWTNATNQLAQMGVTDPVLIDQYAKDATWRWAWQRSEQLKVAQTPQPVTQPAIQPIVPPQPAPDLKAAFLNRIPGAAPGSVQPPASNPMPNGRKLSLQEAMMQGLIAQGYSPGSRLPMAAA